MKGLLRTMHCSNRQRREGQVNTSTLVMALRVPPARRNARSSGPKRYLHLHAQTARPRIRACVPEVDFGSQLVLGPVVSMQVYWDLTWPTWPSSTAPPSVSH
jgi:hypothetical protein